MNIVIIVPVYVIGYFLTKDLGILDLWNMGFILYFLWVIAERINELKQ